MSALKDRITADMKTAMREKDKERLATIRMLTAAIKQREVDERIELTDDDVIAIVEKLVKQRREAEAPRSQADSQSKAEGHHCTLSSHPNPTSAPKQRTQHQDAAP